VQVTQNIHDHLENSQKYQMQFLPHPSSLSEKIPNFGNARATTSFEIFVNEFFDL